MVGFIGWELVGNRFVASVKLAGGPPALRGGVGREERRRLACAVMVGFIGWGLVGNRFAAR